MSPSSALLLGVTLATAVLPFVLIFLDSRLAHSRYRNELWLLRDRLVDDVLEGRIQRTAGTDLALRLVETHIRVAGRHTLTDLLLAMATFRNRPPTPVAREILEAGVRSSDIPRLTNYLNQLWDASAKHLLRASPLGILLLPFTRFGTARPSLSARKQGLATRKRRFRHRQEALKRAENEFKRAEMEFRRKAEPIEIGEMAELVQSGRSKARLGRGPVLDELLSASRR